MAKKTKKVTEAAAKVTERVPKAKKVIEVLLLTSFCGTLNKSEESNRGYCKLMFAHVR